MAMTRRDPSPLGGFLLASGRINERALREALDDQRTSHERVGEILCRLGYLGPEDLVEALGDQLGIRRFDPSADAIDPAALELVPCELARRHILVPVRIRDGVLTV